jgi:hypothetical protein
LRQIELDLAAFGLVVARKAISAERESERREPRVVRIVGKTVDAARQLLRQPAGQEQIPRVSARYWPGFGSKPAASANVRAAGLSRSRTSL